MNQTDPYTATIADTLIAGRDFPTRKVIASGQLVDWNAERAAAFLNDVREFWLSVAQGNLDMAKDGCGESIGDARDALAKAEAVTP